MVTRPLPRLGDRVLERSRLHSTVAEFFEERILSGTLGVGERLPSEGDIARDFGVSTRSVREALQILETKGLVRRRHGERTVVTRGDVDEFLGTLANNIRQRLSKDPEYLVQLMSVRMMIEIEVLGILASSEQPIAPEVEAALQAMEQARDGEDITAFTEADAAFHFALVKSAGNEILTSFYNNLYGLITELIRVTSRVPSKSLEAAYAEHAEIFSMVCERDEIGAKALMRAQINNSTNYLRLAIARAKQEDKTR